MKRETYGAPYIQYSALWYHTLMDTAVYEKLLQASIRFVSYRPRSEKEIRDFLETKLKRWKTFGGTVVQKVVDRLAELGYVDDAKFAAWWIEQRQTFKPKGMRLIIQELKAKGISREFLEDVVCQFSSDRNKVDKLLDEAKAARGAVQKKLLLWQKLPLLVRKKKLFDFLSRRGFSWDTISRVIDEVAGKE